MTEDTGSGPGGHQGSDRRYAAPGPYGYAAPHPAAQGRPWAPKPGIIPLRPLTVGEILDGAFTVMRWNPKAVLIPSVILAAIGGVVSAAATIWMQYGILPHLGGGGQFSQTQAAQAGESALAEMVLYGVLAVIIGVGSAILTGFLTGVIGQAVLGRKETLGSAWRVVKSRIGPVIAVLLLTGVFLGLGWTVAVGLSVGIGVAVGAGAHLVPLGVVLGIVCGLAASVFALIVGVRWLFAVPAVVLERAGPMKALGRSWRLVRGSWWRVFGIMLLTYVIVGFVSSVIRTPFVFASIPSSMATGKVPIGLIIASAVATVVASALTAPLLAGSVVVLYTDLRMRREGMDIALQAAVATGGQPLTGQPVPPAPQPPGTQPPGVPEPGAW